MEAVRGLRDIAMATTVARCETNYCERERRRVVGKEKERDSESQLDNKANSL